MSKDLWKTVTLPDGRTRMQALRDSPYFKVFEGDLGAILTNPDAIDRSSWADSSSFISEEANITDGTIIRGSRVSGRVSGSIIRDSTIYNGAVAHNVSFTFVTADGGTYQDTNLKSTGHIFVEGALIVNSDLRLSGNLTNSVWDGVSVVGGFVDLSEAPQGIVKKGEHFMSIGPLGSEDSTATLVHTEGDVPAVTIGCWSGLLDEMMPEVERRRKNNWLNLRESKHALWYRQYELAHTYFSELVASW